MSSEISAVVKFDISQRTASKPLLSKPGAGINNLPIVAAHGMGDSCFNAGMKSITAEAGTEMGVYSVCIPTGDTRISDTINGFFLDMDSSVEVFAQKVAGLSDTAADPPSPSSPACSRSVTSPPSGC